MESLWSSTGKIISSLYPTYNRDSLIRKSCAGFTSQTGSPLIIHIWLLVFNNTGTIIRHKSSTHFWQDCAISGVFRWNAAEKETKWALKEDRTKKEREDYWGMSVLSYNITRDFCYLLSKFWDAHKPWKERIPWMAPFSTGCTVNMENRLYHIHFCSDLHKCYLCYRVRVYQPLKQCC